MMNCDDPLTPEEIAKVREVLASLKDCETCPAPEDSKKLTVAGPEDLIGTYWEYKCRRCRQLRLHAFTSKPIRCQHCGSANIEVGRPGSLPT